MNVYINGKLYFKARQEGWLTSLAYFVYWSGKYRHKQFSIDTLHNKGTIYKHLHILQRHRLLTYHNSKVTLLSNKGINELFGGKEKLFTNIQGLSGIKKFLKLVPTLSNLYAQAKQEDRRFEFYKIKHNHKDAKYKLRRAFVKKRKQFESEEAFDKWLEAPRLLTIGNRGIAKISNCHPRTSTSIKKHLYTLGLGKCRFRFEKIAKMSYEDYKHFRRTQEGINYNKTRYIDGCAVIQHSNMFFLKTEKSQNLNSAPVNLGATKKLAEIPNSGICV